MEQGNHQEAHQLLPLVYAELRRVAAQLLMREKAGQTLQPTALVHEAYLRLVDQEHAQCWESRRHFFAAAAEAMRRILIENARRKQRVKHGGGFQRAEVELDHWVNEQPVEDLEALDEAMNDLSAEEPEKADLVKLRYFAGFTLEESAEMLGISRATAARHWAYARAWLYDRIKGEGDDL
jgi:RNA polymerase sigma factor (TIGR02999 family)